MRSIAFALACCASLLAQSNNPNIIIAGKGRVVGKPYSASQVTHSVQTLLNGAHIDRTVTNLVWQDDQGRFRMETTDNRRRVVIQDVVAQAIYSIDMEHKTARKMPMPPGREAQKIAGDVSPVEEARATARRMPNETVEDLGAQSINGVTALGVRITTTIPVGAIGNDRELKSITERWYSNDIGAMVKSVTTDPRSGTNTYELTNIVRAAPDPGLFRLPGGVVVEDPVPAAVKER